MPPARATLQLENSFQAAEHYDSLVDQMKLKQFDIRADCEVPEGPIAPRGSSDSERTVGFANPEFARSAWSGMKLYMLKDAQDSILSNPPILGANVSESQPSNIRLNYVYRPPLHLPILNN